MARNNDRRREPFSQADLDHLKQSISI